MLSDLLTGSNFQSIHQQIRTGKSYAMYNGWTHDHYVSNILAFTPDGCICLAILNCPGSWHDVRVATEGGLFDALDLIPNGTDYYFVADSAFPVDSPRLVRKPKENEVQPQTRSQQAFVNDITSIKQSADWGMAGVQLALPRLKARFVWEIGGFRKKTLSTCTLLFNYRTRCVGLNQIRTIWLHCLDRDPTSYFRS